MEKSPVHIESYGNPASLLEAIRGGHAAPAILQLKAGTDPESKDDSLGGISALGMACMLESNSGPVIVRALVLNGADPRKRPIPGSGVTNLMLALESRRLDSMMILLAAGADINAPDLLGETALFRAVRSGYLEGIDFLVQQGASVSTTSNLGETLKDAISLSPLTGDALKEYAQKVNQILTNKASPAKTESPVLKQAFSWIARHATTRKTVSPA